MKFHVRAAMALLLFSAIEITQAQDVSISIPSPGQIDDTIVTQPPVIEAPAAAPVVEREQSMPTPPAKEDTPGTAITLKKFEFTGNQTFTSEDLMVLVAKYLDHPITLAEVYAAADVITAFYVNQGYTLATVNVPPQKISEGALTLEVIEGRIGKLSFEGLSSYNEARLKEYLPNVLPGQVYRGADFERSLLQLNEIPGLETRAIVRPGEEFGTSDLVIRSREDLFSGLVAIDNFGRESVGELRLMTALTFNNPLHIEDQLQFLGLISDDGLLTYGSLSYSLPINHLGTRASLSYSHAGFDVSSDIPVEGKSDSGRIEFAHPLVRSATDTWRISAGVSHNASESDVAGLLASGTDITLLELGSVYIHSYSNAAVTQLNANLSTNFEKMTREKLLAATPPLTGKQRLRLELDVQHAQPLAAGISALLRLAGVYSPDPLVDTQQFSIGGPGSVRGYPAAEVRGDRGILGSLTLQRPLRAGSALLNPRIYIDSGRVTRDKPGTPGVTDADSLTSAGLGFDLNVDRFSLKVDWSKPLDQHVLPAGSEGQISNGEHGRLLSVVSASF